VIYGSGASFDSGLRYDSLPMDRNFFEHKGVKSIYEHDDLFALKKFREWFLPYKNNISLEELWTAVDLNYKHIVLGTYDWSQENEKYCLDCLNRGNSSYPFSDLISTAYNSGEPGNLATIEGVPVYNKFKFLGDCNRDLKKLIYSALDVRSFWGKTNYGELHKLILEHGNSIVGYITFNYDLVLEKSLKSLDLKPRYLGVNDNIDSPYFKNSFSGESLILKLHGSLNWENESGCRDIEFAEDSVRPDYPKSSLTANSFIEPAIVPPTIFKQEINDDSRSTDPLTRLLINQWRGARQLLKEAEKVIIIGYSFPSSDYHAQRIFQISSMVRRNMIKEQKVLVCFGNKLSEEDELKKKKNITEIFQIKSESVDIDYKFSNLVTSPKLELFLRQY